MLFSHRHYIFEFIQTGIDPCPPLSLQQGLGDLLVGVRLRHGRLTLLTPTPSLMLGSGGTIATHDPPVVIITPSKLLATGRGEPRLPSGAPGDRCLLACGCCATAGTGGTGAAAHQGRT